MKWFEKTRPADFNTLPNSQKIILQQVVPGSVAPSFVSYAQGGEKCPVSCVIEGRFSLVDVIDGALIEGVNHSYQNQNFTGGFTFSVGLTTRVWTGMGIDQEEVVRHDMFIPFRGNLRGHAITFSCAFAFNMENQVARQAVDYCPFFVHNGTSGGKDGNIICNDCTISFTTKSTI